MEASEREIPQYIFEDILFRRRLERNLNDEHERLNKLLAEQVELLQKRKELMADVHAAVLQRWQNEDGAGPESAESATEEVGR